MKTGSRTDTVQAAAVRLRPDKALSTIALRRPRAQTPYGRYAVGSLGLMAIATANGVTRELTYGKALDDDMAHALSLLPMAALFALYVGALERRWPLPSWGGAAGVGLMWATIAVGFELAVGHYVDRRSWSELVREYDLAQGRPGGLVLAWTIAVPSLVRWLEERRR